MGSRASLLAELEEKRKENSDIEVDLKEESLLEADSCTGYNPYDNATPAKTGRGPGKRSTKQRRFP